MSPKPVLARIHLLPEEIGCDLTCNNIAEEAAILLVLKTFPVGKAFVLINDLLTARGRFIKLRSMDKIVSRKRIRSVLGRVSKLHATLQEREQERWRKGLNEQDGSDKSRMKWVTCLLQQIFTEAGDNWKPLYED